ncbi:IniB N-terminal domain-containing protein [Micromonospora sp. H33]|uniref:IniB N-terminal domain-containing protein n=1 Tax=Micromonospora sp. H33 TaxID=3452215 RepID=UPI003F8AA66E
MDSYQTVHASSDQSVQADSQHSLDVDSQQTLHAEGHATLQDFVLNLLTDPVARTAFDLDSDGVLSAAGLSGVTAADVQDLIPLVLDHASAYGLATVAPATGQLGLDPLVGDGMDVVGQVQHVPQQTSVSGSYGGIDVTAGALGAIAVDPGSAAAGAYVLPGIGVGVGPEGLATDLTGVHDVAHTLDADVVGAVDAAADPAVGDVAGVIGNPGTVLDATDSGLLGIPDGLLGGPLSGTHGQVEGVVGALGVDDTLGGLGLGDGTGGVVPSVDVPSTVGGVTGQVDGVVSDVTGTVGVTGAVTGGVGVTGGGAEVHGEASAAPGVAGLTDGLF